ncbi:MAG: ABC transporter permease [Alphaproteobacteria bacterium]|nr:ABC transporter permease [Alphaproteobacteria bacterium]
MLPAMAWRNLWRHGRRTFITAAAMGVSVAFVMAMLAYVDGMYGKMAEIMIDQATGHVQVHHPDYPGTRALDDTVKDAGARIEALGGLPETRAIAPRLNGYALLGGEKKTSGAQLVGVDPVREADVLPVHDRVKEGRWLSPEPAREIVLGRGLADTLEVGVGDQVVAMTQAADGSLGNDLYEVVGISTSGSVTLDRMGAWLHLQDVQSLLVLPDQVHQITILAPTSEARINDPDVLAAAAAVRGVVGDSDDLEILTWWEASPQTAEMMGMSDASAGIMLVIVFGVAGLGILNTMLMSVFERTKELGVMKALGTRPWAIVQLVLWESLLLGAMAAVGGLALGGVLDWLLVTQGLSLTTGDGEQLSSMGVLFDPVIYGVVKPERIVTTVVSLLVVAVLAALWPALRAARLEPVQAMQDR